MRWLSTSKPSLVQDMNSPATHPDQQFPTTRWSHVVLAKQDADEAKQALNELCRKYWRPIYAFVRHRGSNPHDAEDLTQAYFARLLERGYIHRADQAKGRFRAFLIHDLKFFIANEAVRARAKKRGGDVSFIPLDTTWAESVSDPPASDSQNAEAYFDRQWALETVRLAQESVAEEYTTQGKGSVFSALQSGLVSPPNGEVYERWQRDLGMTEGALKVALHRLRDRFRKALEDQILETVSTPEDLKSEMAHLRRALSRAQAEAT